MKSELQIVERFLPVNKYTRPQRSIEKVEYIVVHWTGNPKGVNEGLFTWFAVTSVELERYGSTHFGVDNSGVMQFIPVNEMAYHVGSRSYTPWKEEHFGNRYPNAHTIGIELNHLDWSGNFSKQVLSYGAQLAAKLCQQFDLDPETGIIRHFDVTRKDCPRLFVTDEQAFQQFKNDVKQHMRHSERHCNGR